MLSYATRWIFFVILVFSIVLVVLLVVFLTPSSDNIETIIVNTPLGTIQGRKATDGDYNIFHGIPYAQVNASNPFGASSPYPKFEDIFIANDDSIRCPQMMNEKPIGTVDCLRLHIYVPHNASSNNPLPVMVWIHGGTFETGYIANNVYGPKFLVRHDVILITINYRVGVYGFSCLDIPEVPGNQGLKDQVLAFRWIRDNIEAFGGDPKKVTAFGLSAGAHSVDFHIISDTEPLFENAIMQSGSSLASTVFTDHVKTAPIDIASYLGYNTNSIHEAISYLSATNSDYVVQAWTDLGIISKPCTEMKFDNVEPFLTRPWVGADAPKARNMTILTGNCIHERLAFNIDPAVFENYNAIYENLNATFDFEEDRIIAMERNIRNFYFGDKEINQDMMWPAAYFDSDYTYIHPTQRSINKYLESDAENVYYYMFAYNGDRNAGMIIYNVSIGIAIHADELAYLFDMEVLFPEKPSIEDQLIIDRMTTMWTNLAKYGDPTPNTTTLLPVKWPPIKKDSYNYMNIDSGFEVGRRPLHERMTFWDLFYKYNEKYQKEFDV